MIVMQTVKFTQKNTLLEPGFYHVVIIIII